MIYLLMHKDIKVCKFELNKSNAIEKISEIYNKNHLPFSTEVDIEINQKTFKEWWLDRSIPITRDEYSNIEKVLKGDDSLSLAVKAHALSLDDQYWIKKEDENLSYDDVSFFSNKFSYDVGDIILGLKESNLINYYSPDSTSTGNLKKRWKIINGQKYLFKAGTKPHEYEIFNEIIASKVMELLNIEHVHYKFIKEEEKIYCASLNFVNYNEDFVSAYQLSNYKKKKNEDSLFTHVVNIYKELGIPNYKEELEKMLFIDFILGNTDRHLNNFGVIRDAKTLEFLRVAPIYDTGACLGFDLSDEGLAKLYKVDWKPFKSKKTSSQLDLISDFSWLDLKVLKDLVKEVDKILVEFNEYISNERRRLIISFLLRRINIVLEKLEVGETVYYIIQDLTLLERRIINYVKKHSGELKDLNKLARHLDVAYITIYRSIKSLVDKGILIRVGARKTGYWILG